MHPYLRSLAAAALCGTAALAQTWTQIPLPPGVTQFVDTELTYGAEYPLALTNLGDNLWEYREGAWQALPLPAGLTNIGGGNGSSMLPGGSRPFCATHFYTQLHEWNGSSWVGVPLPPGATQIGGTGGVEILDCGARPLASTNYGANLWEWTGSTWSALPLPAGVTAVNTGSDTWAMPGSSTRHLLMTGYSTGLVEWDGSAWVPIPLPAGLSSIEGTTGANLQPMHLFQTAAGRAGAYVTISLNLGTSLVQWRGGAWQNQPMPAGIDLTGASGNRIVQGSRNTLLLSANSGSTLWALDTSFRRTWTQIPLPPGVTQFVDTELTFGARYPLALTNLGDNLWEYRNGAWQALPLPAGLTNIGGGNGSSMLPGGSRPFCATHFYTQLHEWNGSSWVGVPLPPGATQIGGTGGVEILDCGARPLASTNYGANLWEWTGSTWSALPLPAGVTAVNTGSDTWAMPGSSTRHLLMTGYSTGLVEWDGSAWVPIPLPAGLSSIEGTTGANLQPMHLFQTAAGRAGANVTMARNLGANLLQWIDGRWQDVPFPTGVSITGASGSRIVNGSRSMLLLSANMGSTLWALHDPTIDLEASSACAGTSALTIAGSPSLGTTVTLTMAAPLASWFTGFAIDPPTTLPMCSCPGLLTATWVYGPYALPIPNAVQLLGIELYAQGLDFLPGPVQCTLPPPVALTDVVRFVIG